MTRDRFIMAVVGVAAASLVVVAFSSIGCEKKTPPVAPAPAAPSQYVNAICPMMGTTIDPTKVTESLTRVYEGKKVAFCCGECTGPWDKLTDDEKAAKLKEIAAK